MEKPSISFFAMNLILLFVVVSFVFIVFELHRFGFVLELGILFVLIFILAFGMFSVYHTKKWGWTLLGATMILLVLNTFFISFLTNVFETNHITIIIFSVVGLVLVFLNLRESAPKTYETEIEQVEKVKEYYPYIDKMEPEEPSIEKTFSPGKFIASKNANKFHIAKCDWAKRISKSNQIWFNSEEEANAQGFEADQCVG